MTTNEQVDAIQNLVLSLNEKGKDIPEKVEEIEDFPYENYPDLMDAFKFGEARLLRFAYAMDSSLLSILGTKFDSLKSTLGMFVAYGGILGALALGFFYSWWMLLLAPFLFLVGAKITKNAYNNIIFAAAFSSESIFCLLYFIFYRSSFRRCAKVRQAFFS